MWKIWVIPTQPNTTQTRFQPTLNNPFWLVTHLTRPDPTRPAHFTMSKLHLEIFYSFKMNTFKIIIIIIDNTLLKLLIEKNRECILCIELM